MANIVFNSVDLSTYGLITPGVGGIHDLPPMEVSRLLLPGTLIPNDTEVRRSLVTMAIHCVTYAADHAALVTALNVLKAYMSPSLGWCALTITDRSGYRTMARSLGFPVKIDQVPYLQNAIEFDWQVERYPFWEDASLQTVTFSSTPGSINNTGQMACWPTYTATTTAIMSGGLNFSVGGQTFTWTTALALGDVLIITTEPPDVTKNGTRNLAGVSTTSYFPGLGVGTNAIVLSDASKFSLKVDYRRRYE